MPQYLALIRHCDPQTDDNTITSALKMATKKELESRKTHLHGMHRVATFLYPRMKMLRMLSDAERTAVHDDVRKMLQVL